MLFDSSPDHPELADPAGIYRPTPLYWLTTFLPVLLVPAILYLMVFQSPERTPVYAYVLLAVFFLMAMLHPLYTAREITVTERSLHWRTLLGRGVVPLDALVDARSSFWLKVVRLRIRDERTLWLVASPATRQLLEHLRQLREDEGGLPVRQGLTQVFQQLPMHTYRKLR